ncbi:MAG TPA: DNA polymerase IV [Planctomycetes bacterium]|nr:DNA polymerase IV [Planctomycetota bacterium]
MPSHRDSSLPTATPRVVHLDVDAFLASVEVALEPRLAGRAVVVGGPPTGRNLVMSCSYEARRFGVRSGMALREAKRLCPEAVFRDGDSQAANRLREEVTRVLLGFSPWVEVASIDDFFVDLTGTRRLFGAACDTAERMREAIRERARLPVTIGIGTNRMMARLAGKLAKPGGIAEVLPGHEEAFLAALPVECLPGVGRAIGAALERFHVRTVGELRLVSREVLFASFGRAGLVLHGRARGIDDAEVVATHREDAEGRLVVRPPRSIRRETTFEPEEGLRERIEAMLSYLIERAAHRLRSHRLVAGSLEVNVRYVDTHPRGERREGLGAARRRAFDAPTDSTDEIWRHGRRLFRELPRRRALVKRIGVALHGLRASGGWQGRLFGEEGELAGRRASRADRQRRLDHALDRLRDELGFGRVLRGSSTAIGETHPLRPDGYRLRTPSLNQ